MGQTLSEPVVNKESSSCGDDYVRVGASCMQGWRINMEDAHTHLLSLPEDKDARFFGVYDGHGGTRVAQYAASELHRKITEQKEYSSGQLETALKAGYLAFDENMMESDEYKDELSGSTAVSIILKDNKIYCANVGDSRAIASVKGAVEQLSFDHKPGNDEETKRIIAAGGWVEFNRVNGNLALSRALGDFVFKKNDKKSAEEQIVTAYPDVVVKNITDDHEFIVMACDGIWDVLTNEEVLDFVRLRLSQNKMPENICEELMSRCLAPDCQMGGLGCDNMTVIIICFLRGGTYEELAKKCERPAPIVEPEDSAQSSDDIDSPVKDNGDEGEKGGAEASKPLQATPAITVTSEVEKGCEEDSNALQATPTITVTSEEK